MGVNGDREVARTVLRAPVNHDFPARTVCISEKCRREQNLGANRSLRSLSPRGKLRGGEASLDPSDFTVKARGNCRESSLRTLRIVCGICTFPEARVRESQEASSPPYSACNLNLKKRQLHVAKHQNVN